MKILNSHQHKINCIKGKFHSTKFSIIIGITIIICLFLSDINSYAQINAWIETHQNRAWKNHEGEDISLSEISDNEKFVREKRDSLWASGSDSWAKFRIGNDHGQVGPSKGNSGFSFKCHIKGHSDYLMLGSCKVILLKGNVKKVSRTHDILIAQLPTIQDIEDLIRSFVSSESEKSNGILIKRNTSEPTLIQTNTFNNSLEVDVLTGSITISSSLKPGGVELNKGERYIYYSDRDNISQYDPDWNSVQIFLDENNWSQSTDSIKEYKQSLNLDYSKNQRNGSSYQP
jgi:hypothetical protein